MTRIIIDSQYHRDQFDDYLAGGKAEYRDKIYYWLAQDSNYGFGWEIEPIAEEEWSNLCDDEIDNLIKLVNKCLYEHKTEYVF